MTFGGLLENPPNNGLISKLNHYWLELPIPEWVSLVWPMRSLSGFRSCFSSETENSANNSGVFFPC